jgi:hypothetical protein
MLRLLDGLGPPIISILRHDEVHGRGPSVWAAKAVELWTRFGTPCVVWLPVTNSINTLLAAGAEVVPTGRIGYLDVEAGEPHPHPSASALFVLRDRKRHRRAEEEEREKQPLIKLSGR